MGFKSFYNEMLKKNIFECGYETDKVELIISSRPDLGQFQCNDAMKLAKKYKKNPYEIAEKIVEKLKKYNDFKEINIAKPGFINITFNDEIIIKYLNELYLNGCININNKKKNRKIFIDYGGANVAKTLHVGHIRSANIGEALKRLCIFLGYDTISDVHLGDWGLQMGMIIYEIKQRYPNLGCFSKDANSFKENEFSINVEDLETLYPIASQKAKNDENVMKEIKKITSELQRGQKGYTALWQYILKISLDEIKKNYTKLNVNFDLWQGESDAAKYVDEMIDYLKSKNLIYESDGALIMDISDSSDTEPMPPLIIKKSDGADLYSTTELACLYFRVKTYDIDEIWYVVDNRQSLHFTQVFRAAYKSEIVPENIKLHFIGFGTMNSTDGKPFKTREGTAMTLSMLLTMIKDEVNKNLSSNIIEDEKNEISEIISIAVLKCSDLITNISTDYIFDPVKFSKLNGNTGVYLLYSTLRIKSLLNKLDKNKIKNAIILKIICCSFRDLALKILNFKYIVKESFNEKSLHNILEYLFDLNGTYNNIYSKYKIINEEDLEKQNSLIFISKCVYDINVKLLKILAIDLPNKI